MSKERIPIDISNTPELLRLAEEVQATREPRVLRRNGEDLAVLAPIRPTVKRRVVRRKTRADYDAFHAAAGGWKDVDVDKLIADIYASRSGSSRPPIDL